jgi:pimeloyl-ACP methyl ester carboxylesterase
LPEDLLEVVKPLVCLMWGTADPWEPYEQGKEYQKFESVTEFIPLQGAGHCPMDEQPELVNPKIVDFVLRTAAAQQS